MSEISLLQRRFDALNNFIEKTDLESVASDRGEIVDSANWRCGSTQDIFDRLIFIDAGKGDAEYEVVDLTIQFEEDSDRIISAHLDGLEISLPETSVKVLLEIKGGLLSAVKVDGSNVEILLKDWDNTSDPVLPVDHSVVTQEALCSLIQEFPSGDNMPGLS